MTKILALHLTLLGSLHATTPVAIESPVTIQAEEHEQIMRIEKDAVLFKNSVIREMAFGENVTVAYKNITQKSLSPKFTVKVYNLYGFLLAEKAVGGSIFGGTHLDPGELGGDKIYLDWIDYKEVLKHTHLVLRDDFSKPHWVSISQANFSIQQ